VDLASPQPKKLKNKKINKLVFNRCQLTKQPLTFNLSNNQCLMARSDKRREERKKTMKKPEECLIVGSVCSKHIFLKDTSMPEAQCL
jgi:hypothetical protein